MQRGSDRPAAGARSAGVSSRWWRASALLLSLAVSACANLGQFDNLAEGAPVSVAFESVDGPPAAVSNRIVKALKEEAGARQIAVAASKQANYRLRGYFASHADAGGNTITWAWDVYNAGERRVFRLSGRERADGSARSRWEGVDEAALRAIARAGIAQFAQFAAAAGRHSPVPAVASAPTLPERGRAVIAAWIDDWTPEAAGIFRVFRRDQPTPGPTETAPAEPQAAAVPLPRDRPTVPASDAVLAFAVPED